MLFVDPKKLDALIAAAQDCVVEIKDAHGLRIKSPQILEPSDDTWQRNRALAFLSLLTGYTFAEGGTQFVTGFGEREMKAWPPEPVRFTR